MTFLSVEEIIDLEKQTHEDAGPRVAQKKLAEEVVRDLHGQEALDIALKITEALFTGSLQDLDEDQRRQAVVNMEKITLPSGKLEDILVKGKIASSKREAREWIKGNAISLNGVKVKDPNMIIDDTQTYIDNVVLIRRGKKNNYAIVLEDIQD